MRNKLTDLNNHMFEQLERLNDDDLSSEELDKEIKRAKAMSGIASNIISNAALALEAQQYLDEYSGRANIPEMIGVKDKEND